MPRMKKSVTENEEISWVGGGFSAEENRNRILAEAKAYRAWAYRYLSFGWGDVPLVLHQSLGSKLGTSSG